MINYYEVHGVSPPPELLVKIADALDEELPRDDRAALLRMMDALADRSSKRKAGG